MQACIGELHGKPVLLELKDNIVSINGEAQPIKNLTEDEIAKYNQELANLDGLTDHEGRDALINAVRANFLAQLLGKAVGDECVNLITHILDSTHYEVLKYLGEAE